MTPKRILVALGAFVVLAAAALVLRGTVDVPFTDVEQVFSVGILRGSDPLSLADGGANPIVTRDTTGDPEVSGVADPWLVVRDDRWFVFFEVIRRSPGSPNDEHGVIGYSSSDDAGATWDYRGVVLEEPWHLSYPQVFAHEGSTYMVPESSAAGKVTLYRATSFPTGWEAEADLLDGTYTDPTIFEADGRWWLLATSSGDEQDDTLELFTADDLAGPYRSHPASPIVSGDVSRARSAGPVVATGDGLVRFAQDNSEGYGRAVRAFRISTLTDTAFAEEEIGPAPLLEGSGSGWNAGGMHHIVPVPLVDGTWVASVDGFYEDRVFGFDR